MANNHEITWDTDHWKLLEIEAEPGETFTISFPDTAAQDPDREETIIYMHPGITENDVYYVDDFHDWKCEVTVKKLPGSLLPVVTDFGGGVLRKAIVPRSFRKVMSLIRASDITFTFAAIVDYNNTAGSNAKYVSSNSVCKIKIDY